MSIVRHDPWNTAFSLNADVSRWLEGMMRPRVGDPRSLSNWVPAADVREESDSFVINADIPGVKLADIEVTMEDGVLSIKGERKLAQQSESDRYISRVERVHGTFMRSFQLPDSADPERVTASGRDGELSVRIAKREARVPRRIEVHAQPDSVDA
ncbi:MAG: Hsp20/alpha crystallin family protein [Pseudomonadales bacterium]|nr:Hsp20/alpha crystallin family protein [Pseudomonadales bacterium]